MSIRNARRTCQWLSWVHDLLNHKHFVLDGRLDQAVVRIKYQRTVTDGGERRATSFTAVARIVARGSTDRVHACPLRLKYDRVQR